MEEQNKCWLSCSRGCPTWCPSTIHSRRRHFIRRPSSAVEAANKPVTLICVHRSTSHTSTALQTSEFLFKCNTSSASLRICLIFISIQAKIFRTKMIQQSGMSPCHRTFSMSVGPSCPGAQMSMGGIVWG